MSWAAHDLENYVIQKHLGTRVSFLAVVTGALLPDLFTKGFVYGWHVGGWAVGGGGHLFHRDWPGAGFTHSMTFGVVAASLVLLATKNRAWALGILIGQWAHVLTDVNDTAGTMLFFPFSQVHVSTGMWAYAAEAGKGNDAVAYYSSLGGVWDFFWLLMGLLHWRVLQRSYFETVIRPADPGVWSFFERRLHLSTDAQIALYRGMFFYGTTRLIAWTLWAHLVRGAPWDISWGGPHWIRQVTFGGAPFGVLIEHLIIGAVLFAGFLVVLWRTALRRAWARAVPVPLLSAA